MQWWQHNSLHSFPGSCNMYNSATNYSAIHALIMNILYSLIPLRYNFGDSIHRMALFGHVPIKVLSLQESFKNIHDAI